VSEVENILADEGNEVLGFGSSQSVEHVEGGKCQHCRWTEVYILADKDGVSYHLVTIGESELAGERTIYKMETTTSPTYIVERLYRKSDKGEWFLPRPSHQALVEASDSSKEFDSALQRWQERKGI